MKDTNAQFDPQANPMMEEGLYPAHVINFTAREDHPTKVGDADIFSLTYKLAQETEKMSQKCYKRGENGNFATDSGGKRIPVIIDGAHLVVKGDKFINKKLFANGLFLFKGSEGSGRNGKYTEFLEVLGIELEEVDFEGHKVKKLQAIEEKDVLGKAVMVKVIYKENNKGTFFPTVTDIFKWESGTDMSPDEAAAEDLPF